MEGRGFKSDLELGFFPSFQLMLFLSLIIPYSRPLKPRSQIAFHFPPQVIQSLSICPRLVGFVMNILAKLITKQVSIFCTRSELSYHKKTWRS